MFQQISFYFEVFPPNTNVVLDFSSQHYLLLANSANTKCRPLQVKIKFIIDGLQQRCHMTFLNSLFGVFLPRKIITILRKIAANFRQVSLKGVLVSVNLLECLGKIL